MAVVKPVTVVGFFNAKPMVLPQTPLPNTHCANLIKTCISMTSFLLMGLMFLLLLAQPLMGAPEE